MIQELDETKLEAFTNQVLGDLAAGYGGVMTSIGDRLGFFEALAQAGPLTSSGLAERTNCAERYVREWLKSQVAAGYIEPLDDAYALPPEHAAALEALIPAFNVPASMWLDEEQAIEAFRTGAGVPWGAHHARLHEGVAAFYRTAYGAALVPEWLPALDGVVEKLQSGAKVADVGCGHGHSTLLMAEAFPNSRFHGYDSHKESIAAARGHADGNERVTFAPHTATDYDDQGFDLICFFDALHDMGDPVAAARHARTKLAPGGTVLLVEPNAAETVGPIARLYYSASTVLCCAHALSEGQSDALGAQAGEERLEQVFREAGFGHWRKAAETPFNLILEARA
jgi:2-polyprenyl-3-methyl-5-hydroxy-6-metoxy-1,4-benzoquinol methylase